MSVGEESVMHEVQGQLTPEVLHASGSGRHSLLCFCSGGPLNPTKKINKEVFKMVHCIKTIK